MSAIWRTLAGAAEVAHRYRALLDTWPVPREERRVPTRHGETFVVASGPAGAPPVIALAGSGATAAHLMRDVAVWAPHARVYAVDVIGEPGASAPARPPLASDAHAEWLDDVLDGLGVARAAFVGVSLGGWLALDYATRRPTRVEKLALVCPGGIGRQKLGFLLTALALRPFGAWGRRRTLVAALGPAVRTAMANPTPETRALGAFSQLVFAHFRPRTGMLPRLDDDALASLAMPVLAIVGGQDALLDSHETRRRLLAHVPQAQVRLLAELGHLLPGQADAILDFVLARDSAPAAAAS